MRVSQRFGELTFNNHVMKEKLSHDIYTKLQATIKRNEPLDKTIASDVAHAMKEWAIGNGATHFTHWFQPLRGGTAEKHDSFIHYDENDTIIERFSAQQLIQSEPDASSFPSGGMRSTFEARGYTAWDPTSPVFLKEASGTKTLVIPSVFLSWTGTVLDHKTPLLRSQRALEDITIRLQRLFGNRNAKHITVFAGPEQEYFLLSKELVRSRPDLSICGRTLFGAQPAKGQQMEDHYFGSIKPRILNFMEALDLELHRHGIPAKTRHNEVAPNQFEIAPLYEECNRAIDHNLQLMDIIAKIADEHNFMCTMHEKPFAGVNGSAKHFNWSLGDNTGANYLEPSGSPVKNLTFLITIASILQGVQRYGHLLRASVADAGNDHRLGAHEAPPAIMSVYLGEYITQLLDDIENIGSVTDKKLNEINLGIRRLPSISRDFSDRNRTSPIAFTGNKFEFRAVGSSQNCSDAAIAFNLMVTDGFTDIYNRLKSMSGDAKANVLIVIKDMLKESKSVRFEGNNYDAAWVNEAESRGLMNLKNTPEALQILTQEEIVGLFERYHVLSGTELHSQQEIRLERYVNTLDIEFRVAIDMVQTRILPTVAAELKELTQTFIHCESVGITNRRLRTTAERLSQYYETIDIGVNAFRESLDKWSSEKDLHHQACLYGNEGLTLLHDLRLQIDLAEQIVSNERWPLAKYQDMLITI